MQNEIAELLQSISLNATQETVDGVSNRLHELSQSPDYVPSLVGIVTSSTASENLRRSALIAIENDIRAQWNNYPPELHGLIVSNITQIIQSFSTNLAHVSHFAKIVIMNAFANNEYPSIMDDIIRFCSNPETLQVGLILANAVCAFLRDFETAEENFAELTNQLVPFLFNFIASTDVTICLTTLFGCFYKLTLCSYISFFGPNFELFSHVLDKFFLLANIENNPYYHAFAKKATNFICAFLSKYYGSIDPATIQSIFTLVCSLLASGQCIPYVRTNLLRCIHYLVQQNDLYMEIIHENADSFFQETIFPQFLLTLEDINAAVTDPKSFTDDIHKSAGDFNDTKETASIIIQKLASREDNDQAREVICNTLLIQIQSFGESQETVADQGALFSAAHFFSSAANSFALYSKPFLTKLINEITPLFTHESELVRAAGFLMISRIHANMPPVLIAACLQGSMDDSHLVRYYAQQAASNLLDKIPDDGLAAEIQSQVEDNVSEIMTAVLETSNEFADSIFNHTLIQLVRFFGVLLLPSAQVIAEELIAMISLSGQEDINDTDAYNNVIKVNQSLANLVELVSDQGDGVDEFMQSVFMSCMIALGEITNVNAIDPFLETVFQVLSYTKTFLPEYWGVTEVIIPHYSNSDPDDVAFGAVCEIFSLLLAKDVEFESRPEIASSVIEFIVAQMQALIEQPDSWNEFAKPAQGILVRVSSGSPLIQEVFPSLCQMTLQQIQTIDTLYHDIDGAVLLMNSLIINNIGAVQQSLGSSFHDFMVQWVQWPVFPETAIGMITNFEVIASEAELRPAIMNSVIVQLCEDILSKSVENGDEFDQDVDKDGIVWYDFGESLNTISSFLSQIQQSMPELFAAVASHFEPEEFADLERLPEIAALYIQTRDSKIKA